ncbi:hypothetical protein F9C11_02955 [Amycolatopsis sp. VS8301801F10]|uniref:hypothetical protein n=1 Tax=Amycolatopsis sp. VS8301801F10 TaxID=2652442 RepID=UPI0038FCB7FD
MKKLRILVSFVALGVAATTLTACDSSVNGDALPSTPAPSSAPTSSPANPFASRNQCALLDQILSGKGFPKATPTEAQAQRSCGSQGGKETNFTAIGLLLQEGQRYSDNIRNPSKARSGKLNGRPFVEDPEPLGSSGQCSMFFAVEPNSRAVLDVTGGTDTAASCRTAEDLASKLEPLLPKN